MTDDETGDRIFKTYIRARHEQAQDRLHFPRPDTLGRQEDWEEPSGRSDGLSTNWLGRHDKYDE